MRRDAQIEKQLRALGSTADTPGLSATNTAQIGNSFVPSIGVFLFPTFHPFQHHAEHLVKTTDGVVLSASRREGGVNIHAFDRNTDPKRAIMFENNLHVGGFTQNANVWQHSEIGR